MYVGPGLAIPLSVALAWRRVGVETTYKARVKRFAFAARYGRAGEWMFRVSGSFLQDFCDAVEEIVREENRPGS